MSITIVSVNASAAKRDVRKWPASYITVYADKLGLRPEKRTLARSAAPAHTHGHASRMIYVYPAQHYQYWAHWLDTDLVAGAFGEHLTVNGAEELNVRIGDHWTWGRAVFEVAGHGQPSPRLDKIHGSGFHDKMSELGLCGWYLKTITPGEVPTTGTIFTFAGAHSNISVLESFRVMQRRQQADSRTA